METVTTTHYSHEGFNLTFNAIEDTINISKTDTGYTIKYLVQDEDCISPRENDNLGTMICFHPRYNLGDKHEYSTPEEAMINLAENYVDTVEIEEKENEEIQKIVEKNYLMLPLFLYDHSGITMNTTGFSCRWDSGQVGIIYVSHKAIKEEYGTLDIEKATKLLQCEVSEYDKMLTGDVYGLVSETYTKDKEQIDHDSCWGYFGREYALEALETEF